MTLYPNSYIVVPITGPGAAGPVTETELLRALALILPLAGTIVVDREVCEAIDALVYHEDGEPRAGVVLDA